MHTRTWIAWTMVCFASLWSPESSAEPSLEETIEYIETKITGHHECGRPIDGDTGGFANMGYSTRFDRFEQRTGVLSLRAISIQKAESLTDRKEMRYSFSLSRMSTRVEVDTFRVQSSANIPPFKGLHLYCSEPKCIDVEKTRGDCTADGSYRVYSGECFPQPQISETPKSGITLLCINDAERVAKAFKHAIKLSGGKSELF